MRCSLLLLFFTFSLFGGTLEIGERGSYWVLPYCEYAPIENMNNRPQELSNTVWIRDKTELQLNPKNRGFWMKVKVKNQDKIEKKLFLCQKETMSILWSTML